MKSQSNLIRTVGVMLLLLAAAQPALAQFCAVCGTNPCGQAGGGSGGLQPGEPPSPYLAPQENVAMGTVASRLISGASQSWSNLTDAAQRKLLVAKPIALLNAIDQLSASAEELRDPTTPESWGRAVQVDAINNIIKSVYSGTLRTVSKTAERFVSTMYKAGTGSRKVEVLSPSRIEQFFSILTEQTEEVAR